MNLPYAQEHLMVLMLKAGGGEGAQLAKTFVLLRFNTTMINHKIKSTWQNLLLPDPEAALWRGSPSNTMAIGFQPDFHVSVST